jgi:hypothetical protein
MTRSKRARQTSQSVSQREFQSIMANEKEDEGCKSAPTMNCRATKARHGGQYVVRRTAIMKIQVLLALQFACVQVSNLC